METQQNNSANQQQERLAAEMQRQRQYMQQQQYQMQKQNFIMQINNGLQQVDPFEVIKMINQYGVYTLSLEVHEKLYMTNLLYQLFSSVSNEFTVENWQEYIRILCAAVNTTNNMQIMQIGRGGYNQFGMMNNMGGYGGYNQFGGMGMGMNNGFGNQFGGGYGGYNQFGGYNNQFGMMGGPAPQQKTDNPEADKEATINQFKQIFSIQLYQCDPIIFINYLLQENYEPKLSNNEPCVTVLRQLIGNSLWRTQDNVVNIIYNAVSYLYNTEYQRKMNGGGGAKPQADQFGGMNNMGGYNQFGMAPPMNGMGMPMNNGFGNQFGGGMPGMPGMMNGMGMPGMGMGGDFNSQFGNQSPSPLW